jgi:hypothetical protein
MMCICVFLAKADPRFFWPWAGQFGNSSLNEHDARLVLDPDSADPTG